MMKRTWSILLCLAMLVTALSACGSAGTASAPAAVSASEATGNAESTEITEAAAEEAPAAEPGPAPAEDPEESGQETAASEVEKILEDEPPVVLGDPFDAMREEYFSYPLEGENNTISY